MNSSIRKMVKWNKRHCLALVLLIAPNTVFAVNFNYDYFEVGITKVSLDVASDTLSGNGLGLGVSFGVSENFALQLGYEQTSIDATISGTTLGAEASGFILGLLYHAPISDNADIILGIDIIDGEVDTLIDGIVVTSADIEAENLVIGIKLAASNYIIYNFSVDIDLDDNETSQSLGYEYHPYGIESNKIVIGLIYTFFDDGYSFIAGTKIGF